MRCKHTHIALLVIAVMAICHGVYAQQLPDKTITLHVTDVTLGKVLENVQAQTGIRFIYSPSLIQDYRKVDFSCNNQPFKDFLEAFLTPLNIRYKIVSSKKILLFADGRTARPVKDNTRQETVVNGIVTDEEGIPLPGATIQYTPGNQRTLTDDKGMFTLVLKNLKADSLQLQVSYVNHQTRTVMAEAAGLAYIMLKKLNAELDDIVVIGYGTAKKKDVSGAVSSIAARDLKDNVLASAAEALQGRLAGVQLTTSEGAPGAEIIVRVRGGNSITQDNSPIYIVDGVQVENALTVLAPQDIASIDVLKDAAATAIYGARGANGVIMITTKSGKPGKTRVSLNTALGWHQLPKELDVLSPYDFIAWQYERSRGNIADSTTFAKTYGTTWDTLDVYRQLPAINWQQKVFGRKALYQNHHLSVNGGNATTTFNLSTTLNNEGGIQLQSAFNRKTLNFRIDHKSGSKLKLGATVRYLDQVIDGSGTTNTGTRTTNKLRHSIVYRPFDIATLPASIEFDEAYYLSSNQVQNPVLLTLAEYRRQYTKATYATAYFSLNITRQLVFKSTIGFDNTQIRYDNFYSKLTPTARTYGGLPVASIGLQNNNSFTNNNILQYNGTIQGHHQFSLLAGQEWVNVNARSAYTETRFFPADITPEKALANMSLGNAPVGSSQPLPVSAVNPPSRIISFFGRLNYSFKNKYTASFNLRNDRSSKFSYDKGALIFPSGALSWYFSKERWLNKLAWLTDGKLRLGYGMSGNNRIGDLLYTQLYGVTGMYALNHAVVPAFSPTALANPNLTWEKSISRNLGIDLAFLNNRIQLSVDVYSNTAHDLLLAIAIPPTLGYTTQIQNMGSTSNKGLEIQLAMATIKGKLFTWTSDFNIAFNSNKVKSLGGLTQLTRNSGWQGTDGADDYLVKVGQPVGLMYGFVTEGFYKVSDFDYNTATGTYTLKAGIPSNASLFGTPQPGSIKLKDVNGDGVVNTDGDRTIIGNANPTFIGGWNNRFTYRNIDLSVFLNFVVGNDIYNANKIEWVDGSFPGLNMLADMKHRFTYINANGKRVTTPDELAALNANATMWSPARAQRYFLHSWAVENGSYLRLNNITLGYTFPKRWMRKMGLQNIRMYASAANLLTLTGYSGYDPDVTTRRADPLTPGVDFAAYPKAKAYVFGLNVTF
jgi:TonB-linked SusC/RagA family outer membrane protein